MFAQKYIKASTVGAANGNFTAAGGISAYDRRAAVHCAAAPQTFCSFMVMLSAAQPAVAPPLRLGGARGRACQHALPGSCIIVCPIALDKPIVTLVSRALAHHSSRNDDVVCFLAYLISSAARNVATLFVATAAVDTINESNGIHYDGRLKVYSE